MAGGEEVVEEEEVVVIGEGAAAAVVVVIGEGAATEAAVVVVVVEEEVGTTVDMEGREGDTSTNCIILLQSCQCVQCYKLSYFLETEKK